jgi:hypothetical protein
VPQADRILDLGFAKAMDAIVRAMPRDRQTLLFSATQTTSVAELARLSLRNPAVVSTTPSSESATPDQLVQAYVNHRHTTHVLLGRVFVYPKTVPSQQPHHHLHSIPPRFEGTSQVSCTHMPPVSVTRWC